MSAQNQMSTSKYASMVNDAINALEERKFYTPYPEHPKAYGPGSERRRENSIWVSDSTKISQS